MASAPCSANARGDRDGVVDVGAAVGTSRWPRCARVIGWSAGHTARTASKTSSGKRSRFSSEPPYSSVRRLDSGERNDESR